MKKSDLVQGSKSTGKMVVKFKKLDPKAQLPSYATPQAAGMDIRALVDMSIGPGTWAKVPTGIASELPPGWELQVRGRSGLALKFGVTVLNSPGTIDSDYRGEIGVTLINHSPVPFVVAVGDRIAQLVLAQAPQGEIQEVVEMTDTQRGTGGHGSTGVQ